MARKLLLNGLLSVAVGTLLSCDAFAPRLPARTLREPAASKAALRAVQEWRSRRVAPASAPPSPLFSTAITGDSSGGLRDEGFKIEVRQFARFLQSAAWFSWWAQVILNVVSGVILFFTNAFVASGQQRNLFANGFVFAASGLALGAVSVFWTWGFTGVARRLRKNILEPTSSLAMIRRVLRTAIGINVLGLLTSLIGAEQFVGTLMAKVLSQQGLAPLVVNSAASLAQTVQPLDIFVIQANTNTLLSHFASLVVSLVLLIRYGRLTRVLEQP